MKEIILVLIALALLQLADAGRLQGVFENAPESFAQSTAINGSAAATTRSGSDQLIAQAFEQQLGSYQVQGRGRVTRVLGDDNDGSAHQRFIIRLDSGQTLLVAHNIDLAPRIPGIKPGDEVEFFGEYEWNNQGGVMHWTHNDPQRRHVAGWLRHAGRTYQ